MTTTAPLGPPRAAPGPSRYERRRALDTARQPTPARRTAAAVTAAVAAAAVWVLLRRSR